MSGEWRTTRAASAATWITLLLLTCIGVVLRSLWLSRHGMWWDEAALWSDALTGDRNPNEAPLNTWLTYLTMLLLRRDDAVALHVPALVFGSLTVPAAFALGRRLVGNACGLATALLVTCSPTLLAFSQDARPYALLILLTTAQLAIGLELLDRWRLRRVALLTALTIAAAATHLLALPFSVGIGVALLLVLARRAARDRAERARWLGRAALVVGAGALALGFGLSWLLFRPSMKTVLEAHYPFGALQFVRYVLVRATTCTFDPEFAPPQWSTADAIAAAHVAVLTGGVVALVARRRFDRVLMLTIPSAALLAVLYCELGPKSFWPWVRYATPVIVPLFALVAVGGTAARRIWISPCLLAGLIALHGHATGWPSWARRAREMNGSENLRAATEVRRLGDALKGVVFVEFRSAYGDETPRLVAGYAIYRGDGLPMYVARPRRGVSHVELAPGPGAIAVPLLTEDGPLRLPDGDYAVFAREQTACRDYDQQLDTSPLATSPGTVFVVCRSGGHVAAKSRNRGAAVASVEH